MHLKIVVMESAAILSRPQCVNMLETVHLHGLLVYMIARVIIDNFEESNYDIITSLCQFAFMLLHLIYNFLIITIATVSDNG